MNGSEVHWARAIRGPVTLITLGALFALNNFTPYHFGQTWPVLLIVFGLLSLIRRSAEAPPPSPMPPPSPWTPPPGPAQSGAYRQTQYPGSPAPPSGGSV